MSTEKENKPVRGRTVWDVIHYLVTTKLTLSIFVGILFIAGALAYYAYKEGVISVEFNISAMNPEVTKKITKEVLSEQPKNPVEDQPQPVITKPQNGHKKKISLGKDILRIPIGTARSKVASILPKPNWTIDENIGQLKYEQELFGEMFEVTQIFDSESAIEMNLELFQGYDESYTVIEYLNGEKRTTAKKYRGNKSYVHDYCKGNRLELFLGESNSYFGPPFRQPKFQKKNVRPDEFWPNEHDCGGTFLKCKGGIERKIGEHFFVSGEGLIFKFTYRHDVGKISLFHDKYSIDNYYIARCAWNISINKE